MNKDMCEKLTDIYIQLIDTKTYLLSINHDYDIEDYIMRNDANFRYHGKAFGKSFDEAERGIEEVLRHIEHIIAMSVIYGQLTEDNNDDEGNND